MFSQVFCTEVTNKVYSVSKVARDIVFVDFLMRNAPLAITGGHFTY